MAVIEFMWEVFTSPLSLILMGIVLIIGSIIAVRNRTIEEQKGYPKIARSTFRFTVAMTVLAALLIGILSHPKSIATIIFILFFIVFG